METVKHQQKTVEVNGVNLVYHEAGQGSATLVLVHGFPFSKELWKPQLEALSKHFRVIAYDIRGFGQSERGTGKPSIDLFASDLLQLIDALRLKPVAACGISMGGYIVMNAVTRAPEKFRAVVLADTQCIADSEEGKKKRYATIEKIEKEGMEKFAQGYAQNMLCEKSHKTMPHLTQSVAQLVASTSQKMVTDTLIALAERKETCNALKGLKVPALILCGKEDSVIPLSQSELLHNTIPGSTIKEINEAGHLSNLEQPETFNTAIREFLEK